MTTADTIISSLDITGPRVVVAIAIIVIVRTLCRLILHPFKIMERGKKRAKRSGP